MPDNVRKYDTDKIFDVVVAFNAERDAVKLLNIILDKMMEITDSDAGTLYMAEGDKLCFKILKNNTLGIYKSAEDVIDLPPITLDKDNIANVAAYTAIKNEIVSIDDVYASDRFNFSGPKNYDRLTGYRSTSFLSLPLTATLDATDKVLGVIQLLNATDPITGKVMPYGDVYDPPVLPALSTIAANTLANLMYTTEIQQLLNSFVAVMTQAIDERSPYNRHHTQNVSMFCERFTQFLSLRFPPGHPYHFDGEHRSQVIMAAMLHDIGKIITPLEIMDKADRLAKQMPAVRYRFELKKYQLEIDRLTGRISGEACESEKAALAEALALVESANTAVYLPEETINKLKELARLTYTDADGSTAPILNDDNIDAITIQKGTLTNAEREIMKQHVSLTIRLLAKMPFPRSFHDVPLWAGGHHEFLDGSGYPSMTENVTIEMCILTITDIFDALIANDRPYKKGVPVDKALAILREMADEGKLHKEMVELFAVSKVWEGLSGA
jgi:HD-GYP domain-containing protein (c-di-GMP phosphodiesterase class II)